MLYLIAREHIIFYTKPSTIRYFAENTATATARLL